MATAVRDLDTAAARGAALLEVEDLRVEFETSRGIVRAVDGVGFKVRPGQFVAVVGESGCGKSVSALTIMRLLPRKTARIVSGRVMFDGRDLLTLSEDEMREVRGRDIAMIFQEPMTSLNPVLSIGYQIMEPLLIHENMTQEQARARAVELLGLVGISDAERRLDQYPHQFSGGMRQRVMIAIGLSCNPKLLIADEPTTALDVTIQAQILELMQELSRKLDIAVIAITHNLGIVARYADYVNVMYAARVVERGGTEAIFNAPTHPYTVGLLRSVPRLDETRHHRLATIEGLPPNLLDPPSGCRFAPRCPAATDACAKDPVLEEQSPGHESACLRAAELGRSRIEALYPSGVAPGVEAVKDADVQPILSVRGLKKYFDVSYRTGWLSRQTGIVRAVDDVSFDVMPGETLGLVGESGCGKTTVGRSILRLDKPTAGEILFEGDDIAGLGDQDLRSYRRKLQVIFQDPFSSLNPRMKVGEILGEPLHVYRIEPDKKAIHDRVAALLTQVGLYPYMADRYPHELSGGQRQRVGIARALALGPSFIVCDEAVSALDVSIQAQIINLLEDLQAQMGLTYLFIAHDLAVVRHISSRIVVMYLGRVMEIASSAQLYTNPLHPYTQALLDAAPVPDPEVERSRHRTLLKGDLPSPLELSTGCVFHSRCPIASEECKHTVPQLVRQADGHFAACLKL